MTYGGAQGQAGVALNQAEALQRSGGLTIGVQWVSCLVLLKTLPVQGDGFISVE